MQMNVTEAKGHLLDLVRRAEAGEEVILTRHGAQVVRLVAVATRPSAAERRALLVEMIGVAKASEGPDAARSQDFLYDDSGLPQ